MKYPLKPFDPLRLLKWDVLTGIAALAIMLEIGWTPFIREEMQDYQTLYWLDAAVTVVFICDILLEFARGFRFRGELVLDQRRVIAHYAWWRLTLDLIVVACLGLTLAPQLRSNFLRLPIMWRFYHLGRLDYQIVMQSRMLPGRYVIYTFLKMIMMLYLFCHFAASLYYWLDIELIAADYFGDMSYSSKCSSNLGLWVYGEAVWSPIIAEKWYLQYMYALYYAVVTFTTVGYGDNVPRNPF